MSASRRSLANRSLALAASDPRGAGRPVLLVHGFGHTRAVWAHLAQALPADLRPIAVDLRGHGESPWSPEGDYDLDAYAADLERFAQDRGLDRLHLVAHSLGGNVATLFAARSAARIQSLTLVDTGPALESVGSSHVLDEVESALRSFETIDAYRAWLATLHPSGDGRLLDGLARSGVVRRLDGRYEPALDPGVLGEGGPPERLAQRTRALWQALGSLACPVLLVRGGLSAILSEKVAHEMVDRVLLDGRLVTLPRAGHNVMLDDAEGLAQAVAEFLSTTAAASVASAAPAAPAPRAAPTSGPAGRAG